jgi:hypothetical protein
VFRLAKPREARPHDLDSSHGERQQKAGAKQLGAVMSSPRRFVDGHAQTVSRDGRGVIASQDSPRLLRWEYEGGSLLPPALPSRLIHSMAQASRQRLPPPPQPKCLP